MGLSFLALLISAGQSGTIAGIPILFLQIVVVIIMISALLWAITLGDCPACGRHPNHNGQDPFPTTCKHCGVRLL